MRVLGVDDGSADYFLVDFPFHPARLHKTLHFTSTAKSSATLKPSPSSTNQTIVLPNSTLWSLNLEENLAAITTYLQNLAIFSGVDYDIGRHIIVPAESPVRGAMVDC